MLEVAEPDRAVRVDLNRSTLQLWCWGDPTAPVVLLVHGAYDHGRMFDGVAPLIAGLGYHAVAVDLRGHGDSGPLDTGFAWSLLHLDLALLAVHLGAPVGFVAHSFGCGQALGVAGAFPELVRWVVAIDGLGPPAGGMQAPDDINAAVARSFEVADRAVLEGRREWASVDEMAERRRRNNPRLSPEWTLHLARHGARQGPGGGWVWKADPLFGLGVPSEFNERMLESEMRRPRCPVLALMGTEEDTWHDLTDEVVAQRLAWMHDARLVSVPGTGHYVHVEDPATVVREIAAFVAEVGP